MIERLTLNGAPHNIGYLGLPNKNSLNYLIILLISLKVELNVFIIIAQALESALNQMYRQLRLQTYPNILILSVDIHHNILPQDQEFTWGRKHTYQKNLYLFYSTRSRSSLRTLRVSCERPEIGYPLIH